MNTYPLSTRKQVFAVPLRGLLALCLLLATLGTGAALAQQETAPTGVVNINTADVQTLQLLPRVGPAVAQRIVDHREQNGKFQDKTDLLLVRGIGDATFERLEPYISLSGDSSLREKVRSPRNSQAAGDADDAADDA